MTSGGSGTERILEMVLYGPLQAASKQEFVQPRFQISPFSRDETIGHGPFVHTFQAELIRRLRGSHIRIIRFITMLVHEC